MATTTQSVGTGRASLGARLEQAHRDIKALRGRVSSGAWLTLLLGALVLAALSFYFWYGHNQISEFVKPSTLTGMGQTMLDEKIPEVRLQVQEEIVKQSPAWVKRLSDQAIEGMPNARVRLVDYVSKQIERGLEQNELVSGEQFRRVLRENREKLERDAQDLATSPELTEERFDQLVELLDKDLGIGLKDKSEIVLGSLFSLNQKLERLAPGKDLTPREIEERNFLMLIRRVQQTKGLGGSEPSVGDAATLKSADKPSNDAEPRLEDQAAAEKSTEAPAGTEKLEAAKPAGEDSSKDETKPAEDTPKETQKSKEGETPKGH